ncbi:MAG: peptidyl-prolyl cis-trans isomerase [Candidatus Omnitrophota bacterium]
MLFKNLRKYTKTIMWVIAIFIVPAFVIWNIGSAVKNRRSGYAGKIFNQKIQWREFIDAKRAARNDALMRYGEKFDQSIDLDEQTWTRLILLHEAKKRKISVTNKELLEYIRNLPFLKYEDLTPQNYALIISSIFQQTPAEFEKGLSDSLIMNKLMEGLIKDITVDETEIRKEFIKNNEKAQAMYALIDPAGFEDTVSLDNETALKTYYQANTEAFKKPEQVNVTYVEIKLENFKEEINITDERIEKYYNNNKETYKVTAKNDAEKEITEPEYKPLAEVKTAIKEKLIEKEMQNHALDLSRRIISMLYSSENFSEVVESFGLTAEETGPFSMLEEIPKVGLSFPFLKAAFALKIGEISEIIQTPTAYYILKPMKKIAPYIPEYEDVKDKVVADYKKEEAKKIAKAQAEQIREEIAALCTSENLSFEQAGQSKNLEVKETKDFTRNGYIPELGFAQDFAETIFQLEAGQVSLVINTPKGYCIAALINKTPIDEETFNKEKENYQARVLTKKKNEFLNDWFTQIKAEANPETYLEENQLQ